MAECERGGRTGTVGAEAGGARFRPGDLVRDRRAGRNGVLMDVRGGRYYLRPEGGGLEWTAEVGQLGDPHDRAAPGESA